MIIKEYFGNKLVLEWWYKNWDTINFINYIKE